VEAEALSLLLLAGWLAPGLSSLRPSCRQASTGIGPVAAPLSAPIAMATLSSAASPFCRPEEDPFLLLESCGKAIKSILRGHAGRPLRRTWIEHPYGEEELTLLEEEVLPAIQQCLARVDEIDQALQLEQELEIAARSCPMEINWKNSENLLLGPLLGGGKS